MLNEMVKKMRSEAGLHGNFTNHSLRASGATQLFQNNVSENVIQEVTGHWSTKVLRQYERVAMQQKQAASNILTDGRMQSDVSDGQSNATFQPPMGMVPGLNLPMPVISPVTHGLDGTVNFTVNICPSGTSSTDAGATVKTYEKLLEGIEIEDLQ